MARVTELWIYPVKSLGGIRLDAARLERRGLRHDRRWMVVDDRRRGLTQREQPRLAAIRTAIGSERLILDVPGHGRHGVPLQEGAGEGGRLTVRVWGDTVPALGGAPAIDATLSAYLDHSVRLVRLADDARRPCDPTYAPAGSETGFADGFPLLVTGEGSLEALNHAIVERGAEPVPMTRFRPNVVLGGLDPGAEDRAASVGIGAARLLFVKPCDRCVITTIDQATGEKIGKEPIGALGVTRRNPRTRGVMFGQNAVPAAETALPTRLGVGQEAYLEVPAAAVRDDS